MDTPVSQHLRLLQVHVITAAQVVCRQQAAQDADVDLKELHLAAILKL